MKEKQPFIIDKVTLRMLKSDLIRTENKKSYLRLKDSPRVTYVEHGIYAFIHFHDVCFDYDFSIMENILREIDEIQRSEAPLFKKNFSRETIRNHCMLSELETAFDFFDEIPFSFKSTCDLIDVYEKPKVNCGNPTAYSSDYKRKVKTIREEIIQENGDIEIVKKKRTREIFKSLICYYDKAEKEGMKDTFWKRFELRFTSQRYLKVASIEDLDLPIKDFAKKIQPYIIKLLKRRLGSRAFHYIRYKYIKSSYPYLYTAFKAAGFRAPTTPPTPPPFYQQKLCV